MTQCNFCCKHFNEKYIVKSCKCDLRYDRGCVNCIYKQKNKECQSCGTRTELEGGNMYIAILRISSLMSRECLCEYIATVFITLICIMAFVMNILATHMIMNMNPKNKNDDMVVSSLVWMMYINLIPGCFTIIQMFIGKSENSPAETACNIGSFVYNFESLITQIICAIYTYKNGIFLWFAHIVYVILYSSPFIKLMLICCNNLTPRPRVQIVQSV